MDAGFQRRTRGGLGTAADAVKLLPVRLRRTSIAVGRDVRAVGAGCPCRTGDKPWYCSYRSPMWLPAALDSLPAGD